jgi:hypothetical protein
MAKGKKPAPARAVMKTDKKLKDLKPLPKKNGAETVKSATKNVGAIKKAIAKKAASKSSASSMSVKEHQKDLAEISGNTALRKSMDKTKSFDKAGLAYGNANDKARKSFGLKTQGSKGSKY